jgi:hypothetical protein
MKKTTACCDEELITDLRGYLSKLLSVRSTYFLQRGSALSVWVGIRDQDRNARYSVYEIEDRISQEFPNVKINFHVIPISPGSSLEAFVAATSDELEPSSTSEAQAANWLTALIRP